jgi:hypothetical protein
MAEVNHVFLTHAHISVSCLIEINSRYWSFSYSLYEDTHRNAGKLCNLFLVKL